MYGKKNGKSYEKMLPYHECNEVDYAEFYPINSLSAIRFREIKEDHKRGLFCIDWNAEESIEVYGNENSSNYQRLEVILMPCNSAYTDSLVGLEGGVSPKCNKSLEAQ